VADSLLLLAVGEHATWLTRGPVGAVVAAGGLADDVLAGGELLTTDVADLAGRIRTESASRLAATQERLAAQGVVAADSHRVLGLFPRRGLRVVDHGARDRVRDRVVGGLRPGTAPEPATAVLCALASVAGLARHHIGLGREQKAAYAAHVNSLAEVMGPGLALVVAALRRELRRTDSDGGTVPVVFVPGGDPDGYGDRGGAGNHGWSDSVDGGGGGDGGGGD
jgi:hypothetical protein